MANYRYTVTGSGTFPLDMLRFDEAYPVDRESSFAIEHSIRRVTGMVTVTLESDKHPNARRWESFGFIVADIDGDEITQRIEHASQTENR